MEPSEAPVAPKVRHRLILGKFQVTRVEKGLTGLFFWLNLGGSVTAKVDSPITSDVRVGDLLTLYTEVYADADPGPAPIQ